MAAKTAGSRTGGAAVEAGDRGQRPEALPARASRRRRMGDARDGLRVDRPAVPHPRSRRHVCGSRGRWVGLPRTSERMSRVAVSIVGGGRRVRHGVRPRLRRPRRSEAAPLALTSPERDAAAAGGGSPPGASGAAPGGGDHSRWRSGSGALGGPAPAAAACCSRRGEVAGAPRAYLGRV